MPLVAQQLRLPRLAFRSADRPLLLRVVVGLVARAALEHPHPLQVVLEHPHPQAVVYLVPLQRRVQEEGSLALLLQSVVDYLVVVAALDRLHQLLPEEDCLELLLQEVDCLERQPLLEEDSLALLPQPVEDCSVLLPQLVGVCMEQRLHNMVNSNNSSKCNNNPHKQPYRHTWTLRRDKNKNASPRPCKS